VSPIRPERRASGYRIYTIGRIRLAKSLQVNGFTLDDTNGS
jgi:DNA-binding transcriptional MerR regulator